MRAVNLLGRRFGNRTIIARCENSTNGGSVWLCRCDCGVESRAYAANLRAGSAGSCGCKRIESTTTHGKSSTKEYAIWKTMRQRCENKRNKNYQGYGARGIKVCERWQVFENFLSDMGPRPPELRSIERKNNDGDYEPDNCVWATAIDQGRNKRKHRTNSSGVTGVHLETDSLRWKAQIGVERKRINLGRFRTIEDATAARKAALEAAGFNPTHGR